jgi:DNA-binding FadR family transcriptional regulator
VVRDFRREGELGLLPFFLAEGADPDEAARALCDVLHLRRLVHAEAARSAAERATPEDAARLRAAAERAAVPGPDAWRHELEFFRALVESSRSLVATWIFNTFGRAFAGVMERLPGLWVETPGRGRTLERFVDAVERRRPAEARRILDRHFEAVDRLVARTLAPPRAARSGASSRGRR